MSEFRVLTLNCWGLSLISRDLKLRINEIALHISDPSNAYDIVALQEIWTERDYEKLKEIARPQLPYSHYFHSGYLGSGVCVFSRHRFLSTFFHRYSLNGFAHHVHRGDWFGGKVCGLVEVMLYPGGSDPIRVHIYTTHIHAEYDRTNDLYLPHRLVQSYELSQFINKTKDKADLILLTGDMNFEPEDLGCKLLQTNSKLLDTWVQQTDSDQHGTTCDRPDNIYTDKTLLREYPNGKRIDYIFYSFRRGLTGDVTSCELRMNKIPNNRDSINYSDHVAVCASFKIGPRRGAMPKSIPPRDQIEMSKNEESLLQLLIKAKDTVSDGERRITNDRRFFFGLLLILLSAFLYTIGIEWQYPRFLALVLFLRFLVTLIIGFCIWHGLIGLKLEQKALKEAKSGMAILIANLEKIE